MIPVFALTVLFAIYSFGEFVAEKTKARLSMTLVISITLLLGFWTILPKTIFDDSAFVPFAMVIVGILLTSLGTRINFNQLKEQWKTVLISIIGMSVAVAGIILVGPFFIDKSYALGGAPIFAGGNAAALVMMDVLKAKGLDDALTFCILMLVTQGFVGTPIASFLLRREAKNFIQNPINLQKNLNQENINLKPKKKLINLPNEFQKPALQFVRIGIVATFANLASTATGGKLPYFVACLLLGILFYELGFLEENSLNRTDSSTLILFSTTLVISSNLVDVTLKTILSMMFPLIVCLLLGVIFSLISGVILAKIFRLNTELATAIILTCTFGFPTTFFMSKEVSEAVGRNEEEKLAILNYVEPKMLTGGFVTVTIFSVVIAGIVVGFM